jgi:capsid protein
MSAEQTRGLSMLTPVFTAIKDLDDLIVSAVQGSRNKALLSVILNSTSPSDAYSGIGAVDPDTGALIEANDDNGEAQIVGSLPDGAIMTAPEGTTASVINSSGDIDRDALILRALKIVSMGSGVPYEILAKDLSGVNFSGGKLAFDSFFRLTQFWTDELIKVFQEINKWIQIEASLKGFGVEDLTPENILLEFIGSQNYVDADPAKNSKAETERIGNNITSTTRILAQKGVQIDQIYLEKAQEYLKAEEYAAEWGVPLEVLYSSTQGKANAEIEVEEEIEQDDSITEETINNKFKGLEL